MGLDAIPSPSHNDTCLVYIGTYTRAQSKGIYVCRLNTVTGALTSPALAVSTANPSFLALHPNHRLLYAVGETTGASNGTVNAFLIDDKTRTLMLLNQQTSAGRGPCHLAVDASGRCLLVANYGSGSIASLPIHVDGTLGPPASVIQHTGSSIDPKRQQGPHAHSVGFDPANRRAFCADLGLDKLLVYNFDPATATLTPNDPPFGVVKPGAGVRHFVFSPKGDRVYVINEMGSTITAFDYEANRGALTEFQTISTLPDTFTGPNTGAEIAIHPNGKFLYGSNRGDNSIAVFAIDDATGKLTLIGHQSTLGKTPRMFAIDPTGNFLLAANQDSNSIAVFRVDPATGRLTPTGQSVEVSLPSCVTFVPTRYEP
ncbi:MAG: lactonase family protein [Verrucomicrobiia bacterium]|jgi:6-phosphogluconolactonase